MITKDGKIITVNGRGLNFDSLVEQANEVTGKDDKTVKDAVDSLCEKASGGAFVTLTPTAYSGASLVNTYIEGVDTLFIDGGVDPSWGGTVIWNSRAPAKGVRKIILSFPTARTSFSNMFNPPDYGEEVTEEIELRNSTANVTDFGQCFRLRSKLKKIIGEIDFSSATTVSNMFMNCTSLEEVRFVQNTLKVSLGVNLYATTVNFTNESLVSLANCLSPSVIGMSLRLDRAYYDYIPTIMGYNDNGLFVESEDGTLSLSDFITNIKGWTLGVV